MAEVKTTFIKGRMNKDLDERLVPKGEYRDARNVEISTSEGSNVGTVQNILGNLRVDTSVSSNFKCVGSIADEAKNKIYWFCSSYDKDLIVEWDEKNQLSTLVFVDTKKISSEACLQFGNKLITGINILDDFIIFTDGKTEPKKINIRRCKIGTVDINTHTKLIVKDKDTYQDNRGDIRRENITVIKKRPNKALDVKINHSDNSKEKGIFEKVFPRFSYRYKYSDNEYSAFGPFTNPVFSPKHTDENTSLDFYSLQEGFNTSMVNTIKSIELTNFVDENIPRDVLEIDILYKRDDSNVVYTVATIRPNDEEYNFQNLAYDGSETSRGRYVVTTENIYAATESNQILRPYDNVPKTALSQEIIGNRIVYGNYTQGYDVDNPSIKVNSGYEVRSFLNNVENNIYYNFDSGALPSIKAQRDYQIGVVFGDDYGRETPVITSDEGSILVPWSSTQESGSPNYLSSLILNCNISSNTPYWADYYKFYIKETSGEYYNLLMDKVYIPSFSLDYENKESHVYLSFPSSEINKITEDSYIILKKSIGVEEKPVQEVNRYKVLDISAEAPDSIRYVYLPVGEVTNVDDETTLANDGSEEDSLFQDASFRIDKETDVIEVDKAFWFEQGFPVLRGTGSSGSSGVDNTDFQKNIYVSWKRTDSNGLETHSKIYGVASVEVYSSFRLKLREKITLEDSLLAKHNTNSSILHQDLTFSIFRKELKDGEDFSGKFFVKVSSDDILRKNLLDNSTNSSNTRFVSASSDMFWWASKTSLYENDGINPNIFEYLNEPNLMPQDLADLGGDQLNNGTEWDYLLTNYGKSVNGVPTMFIDSMYLTSANFSKNNYAKHSGQPFIANKLSYPKVTWDTSFDGNWNVEADTTWSSADISVGLNAWTPNVVNALPGIKEVDASYENGISSWRQDIYSQDVSDTYEDGGYYMHLSFFAPGKDLHDGDFGETTPLANVDVYGENSIAGLLKGIWGGGAFTSENGEAFGEDENGEVKFVEFESNYLQEDAIDEAPGVNVGKGYDVNYREQHERQWDPTYSPNSHDLEGSYDKDLVLERFVNNIAVGSKFKFAADASEEIYTILDVKIKHIYNHTPWRSRYQHNADGIVRSGDSVEYAAAFWAKSKLEGTDQVANPEIFNNTPAQHLINRIVNFGKASNRRTCYIIRLDKDPANYAYNPTAGGAGKPDLEISTKIEFIDEIAQVQSGLVRDTSAIFETEPKESLDLNVFYEASGAIPTYLTVENSSLLAPIGSRVEMFHLPQAKRGAVTVTEDLVVSKWAEQDGKLYFEVNSINNDETQMFNSKNKSGVDIDYNDVRVRFYRENGSYMSCRLAPNDDTLQANQSSLANGFRKAFVVVRAVDPSLNVGLDWFNCYSFGDGVESNRIRDDFNAPFISNGAKASIVLEDEYFIEDKRKHGLIYSGLYNATSGLNNLNQFIAAEKITKDLNPTFGSIQKLFSRQSDLIAFCEDRVVKILANKDALFNADGNVNLVATENVLGQATPFVGEHGISQNPESFSKESYRAYFTDKNRGSVLRLSMDGLTPISEAGMHDYFRDNLPLAGSLVGTYDDYKRQYNLTFGSESFENIILNSFISEGDTLNESFSQYQIIPNGDLDSGQDFQLSSVESLYEGSSTNLNSNENINAVTEIINWPGIPKSVVGSYFDNTTIPSTAQLSYELITTVTTDVLGNLNEEGNNVQTNVGATVDVFNEEIDGVFPAYNNSAGYGYIFRDEQIDTDPFVDGDDSQLDGVKYYRSPADRVKYFANDIDNGILTNFPTYSGSSISVIRAPYKALHPNGSYYFHNNYNSNVYSQGAFGNLNPANAAQLSIDSNAYLRTVFSGETIVVKMAYRLRHAQGEDFSRMKVNVQLFDHASNVSSHAFSSTDAVGGFSQLAQEGSLYEGASNTNPFSSSTYSATGYGVLYPNDEYDYGSYRLYKVTNLNDCQIEVELNPELRCIRHEDYGGLAYDTFVPYGDHTLDVDYWNAEDISYSGDHDPVYTDVRVILFEFRVFDKDNPFNPSLGPVIDHLNVTISTNQNDKNNLFITGLAMWKRDALNSVGQLHQEAGSFVVGQVDAAPEYGYVQGVVGQQEEISSVENISLSGQEAIDLFQQDQNLTQFESVGEEVTIDSVSTTLPDQEFSADVTQFQTVTVGSITYTPPSTVGQTNIEFPNEDTPGFDPNYGVNGGIPPWAEVIHHNPDKYSPWSYASIQNYNYGQEQIFGPENTGSWETYVFTDNNGNSHDYYYYLGSTPSDHLTQYNDYPGEIITSYDGQSLPSFNDGATRYEETVDSSIQIFGYNSEGNAAWSYAQLMLEEPMQVGNWYLVDFEYNDDELLSTYAPGTQPSQPSAQDATAAAVGPGGSRNAISGPGALPRLVGSLDLGQVAHLNTYFFHDADNPGYPLKHTGQVFISSFLNSSGIAFEGGYTGDISSIPIYNQDYGINGNVLRVIFKHTANSKNHQAYEGDRLILGFGKQTTPFVIKSVRVIDITQPPTVGDFSQYWQKSAHSPALQHAKERPLAFYSNGGYCWLFPEDSQYSDYSTNNNIIQHLPDNTLPEISDNVYQIEFNLSNNPVTGDFSGMLYIKLESSIHSDGKTRGVRLYVSQPGYYKYNLTLSESPSGEILFAGNNDSGLQAGPYVQNPSSAPNTIFIRPLGQGEGFGSGAPYSGFEGKIDYIKMYSSSTVLSGGNIGAWILQRVLLDESGNFSGAPQIITNELFVKFEQETVRFENCPEGVELRQNITEEIVVGQNYNIRFTSAYVNGGFEIYYFTPNSVQGAAFGFRISNPSENEDVQITNISNQFQVETDTVGSLVFRTIETSNDFSLDNITMTQFETIDVHNDTVSYSEDVRGWVSFKDFVGVNNKPLESGLSLSKKYFTFKDGYLYQHYHDLASYNTFYGNYNQSSITAILNDSPEIIKEFKTLNYEGTQSKVDQTISPEYIDSEIYNIYEKKGWYASAIDTNMAAGKVNEFINKEDKWYNYIKGNDTLQQSIENLYFQGVGFCESITLLEEGSEDQE